MLGTLIPFLTLATVSGPFADTDRDGLLDSWETDGFGPIKPAVHGCKPGRADMFLLFRIRSMMKAETIQPAVDRIKKFYGDLPFTNPDGSRGLNMIPIIIPMPAETDGKGYPEVYEIGMPPEWRGLAHGVLVDNSPGGGGQANRPDWCGTGYNFWTIVHEVGHQLGLPHEPLGAKTGSPFHTSLMNYDYSYQLGGDAEKVNYSDGRFLGMRMKENDLTETVPYAAADLDFLTKRPYFFKIKTLTPKTSAIDWNRNGIFGEKHVRSDVNDGYSASYAGLQQLEAKAAGAPAVAVMGEEVLVINPDVRTPTDKTDYTGASLTAEAPGRLTVTRVTGGKPGKPTELVKGGVQGNPTAIVKGSTLILAYPSGGKIKVGHYDFKTLKLLGEEDAEAAGEATLVLTPYGEDVIVFDGTKTWVHPNISGPRYEIAGLTATTGSGATWDAAKKELVLAHSATLGTTKNRIQIGHLKRKAGKWVLTGTEWVEGEKGGAQSASRPHVVVNPNSGMLNVYVKGAYEKPNHPGLNFLCRQIADKSLSGGWRTKMLGNEWAYTRSLSGVSVMGNEIVYVCRASGYAPEGTVFLSLRASGVENQWLTDFDEIGFIQRQGLANSLAAVKREQWKVSWPDLK